MEKKTRFTILSRCTTLQKLQVFNNDQLRTLTDDFKEADQKVVNLLTPIFKNDAQCPPHHYGRA